MTLELPAELIERLRNAVYWSPGTTLTSVASKALRDCIELLEKEHGGSFPQRQHKLRIGRPAK